MNIQISIKQKLNERINTEELIKLLNGNNTHFSEAVEIALSDEHPANWRAAWMLNHCIGKNDKRLAPSLEKMISIVKEKNDGHQRELLKLIEKYDLNEKQESMVFDICLTIWEEIYKSPSVRITAFRLLIKLVKQYPELLSEIEHLTQDHYAESLSAGIKRQFERFKSEIGIANY